MFDFLKYRIEGVHVIPVALLIPIITVIVVIYFKRAKKALFYPPCTPDSLWANATRGGFVSLPHKVAMSEWVCDHTRQNTSRGATFRMSMPTPFNFFTTADWSLARIILNGDVAKDIQECDKTSAIKNINIFPNIDSILTANTSSSARDKTRKFMAPSFSTSNLQKTTMGVMRRKSLEFMQLLQEKTANNTKGAEVDMKDLNVSIIFEILTESLFDMKVGHKGSDNVTKSKTRNGIDIDGNISDGVTIDSFDCFDCEAFLEAQNAAMKESMVQARNPLRQFVPAFLSPTRALALKSRDKLIKLATYVLKKYRHSHPDVNINSDNTIIGHLVAHDYPSEEHRISDLLVFLIAGHETTAHSLSFFLYCMAKNPEKCMKLQEELDKNVPENAFISPTEVSNLEYFNFCLKEAQRLYPVAPVVGRYASQDITHNGMLIPEGSVIAVHLWAMARQRWINNSYEYEPERWSNDNPQLESLKQIPSLFSMGKRSCIGQNLAMLEMKVLACMLIRNFNFVLVEEPEFELFVTVKPIHLKMKITNRNISRKKK